MGRIITFTTTTLLSLQITSEPILDQRTLPEPSQNPYRTLSELYRTLSETLQNPTEIFQNPFRTPIELFQNPCRTLSELL